MWHASTDSNLRREDPHPCGRLLLRACLAAAAVAVTSYWHGVCFGCQSSAVCLGGLCDSHQAALRNKTPIHHIVSPIRAGFGHRLNSSTRDPKTPLVLYFGSYGIGTEECHDPRPTIPTREKIG